MGRRRETFSALTYALLVVCRFFLDDTGLPVGPHILKVNSSAGETKDSHCHKTARLRRISHDGELHFLIGSYVSTVPCHIQLLREMEEHARFSLSTADEAITILGAGHNSLGIEEV